VNAQTSIWNHGNPHRIYVCVDGVEYEGLCIEAVGHITPSGNAQLKITFEMGDVVEAKKKGSMKLKVDVRFDQYWLGYPTFEDCVMIVDNESVGTVVLNFKLP